jgi:hypothetical protein
MPAAGAVANEALFEGASKSPSVPVPPAAGATTVTAGAPTVVERGAAGLGEPAVVEPLARERVAAGVAIAGKPED